MKKKKLKANKKKTNFKKIKSLKIPRQSNNANSLEELTSIKESSGIEEIDLETNSLGSLFKDKERAGDAVDDNDSIILGGHNALMTMEMAEKAIQEDDSIILIDSRPKKAYASGHIPGAINVEEKDIGNKIESLIPEKTQRIFAYCQAGRSSANVCRLLEKMGYENVVDLGSIVNWTGPLESL